jgi:hypothetical protein
LALRTFAVAFIVMVIGSGPHEKVMTPPAATADTTAFDVQLAGVPVPITRVGREVSTARASAGTAAPPFGFPARSTGTAGFDFAGAGVGEPVGDPGAGSALPNAAAGAVLPAAPAPAPPLPDDPHPASPPAANRPATSRTTPRFARTGRC